jgi:hypothetical protein
MNEIDDEALIEFLQGEGYRNMRRLRLDPPPDVG